VASDISARGLDIPDITHIIQMDLPSPEAFVHRAGRTARAVFKAEGETGKKGIDMVIGNAWEMRRYALLEKQLGIVVHPKALYEGRLCAADGDAESEPSADSQGRADYR
jgi:superfamily II DNA/RNA helicase